MQRSINITGILIWSFLFLFFAHSVNAQESQNPFDLEHRLKEKKEQSTDQNDADEQNPSDLSNQNDADLSDQKSPTKSDTENPFDLERNDEKPSSSNTSQNN